ncbi:NAD-dependent epimerase/dehydratase family protein [Bosea sp. (in: a-proteobacteria)]|jgi:UDP-glucose 4-epimerase|uniref:NAD-dependent epimerase/dehydratase family protein n=1 Tax=Bosea sp. (in: a-proteobacteria) TaxID=1871050 RepID=UPI003566F792
MSSLPSAIVLFGASGFIGRHLAEALAGRVEHLIGVTGGCRSVPGCTQVVTLSELADLPALPADTVVIHVGAFRYDSARFDLAQSDIVLNNVDLNTRVYHFCAERQITEVRLASSIAVYEGGLAVMDDAVTVDLNAAPNPNEAFYAWSKRWAEIVAGLYAQRFGVNSVVFRLSNPYGPYDSVTLTKAHVAPAFVMKALNDDPVFLIKGDPMVERDFTYVGDVVEAFVRTLAWRGRNETYNLCTGTTATLQALAETVLRVAGSAKPIEAGAPGAFGPAKRISTSQRVREALGLEFTSLEAGMTPTVEWYREEWLRHGFKS